ncbi:hypothetical protein GCWU000342_01669 [Shuttleworthella satelles DSM 14600]|uniref:Uncharacterized protein n=1 Tax=Shuttleworthella satelles DSM 14600 TaxID=626523 RepID=C4GCH6_9FIRM|nr:hypothetical protein GCWU000342_01669 [Shuttleworthia satelles DSM 14600]
MSPSHQALMRFSFLSRHKRPPDTDSGLFVSLYTQARARTALAALALRCLSYCS